MKIRVALVTTVLALSVFLIAPSHTPFSVDWHDPASYPDVVKWAGCKAPVAIDPSEPAVASYYNRLYKLMVVGTGPSQGQPYYVGLFVLLHETGHCLQDQAGLLDIWALTDEPSRTQELDADTRATNLACAAGLDGRRINHDTFEWVHEQYGYNGDPDHGTLAEREATADAALMCRPASTEH